MALVCFKGGQFYCNLLFLKRVTIQRLLIYPGENIIILRPDQQNISIWSFLTDRKFRNVKNDQYLV